MMRAAARHREAAERQPSVARGVLGLLAQQRGRLLLIGLLVLAAAAFEIAPPLIVRAIVDRHFAAGNADGLLAVALLYLLAVAATQAVTFLYGYLATTGAQRMLADVRTRLFAHLQRLPTLYFDRTPLGDVISRCTADVDTLDTVFSSGVAVLLANLARLGSIAAAMLALSPALSLVAGLIATPLVLVTHVLQRRVRQAERESRAAFGLITTRLQEDLRSVEVIRAFGHEVEFVTGFRRVLGQGLAAFNRATFYSALYPPATAIFSAVAVATLLWTGPHAAFGAMSISLGTLTAFLLLLQRFFQPLTALGEEWQTIQSALAGAERIFGTLALSSAEPRAGAPPAGAERSVGTPQAGAEYSVGTPQAGAERSVGTPPAGAERSVGMPPAGAERSGEAPPLANADHGVGMPPRARAESRSRARTAAEPAPWPVRMERVEFGYAAGQPVLRGLSMRVRRGEHVALVGRTGAGKTSALHLLAGLYRPWAGAVSVAGRDPAGLDEAERRRVLGVVPQVVQLFSGTVRDNLTLGDASVTDDAVVEAAAIAGADAFIRQLPQGYRTPLSGSGGGAGERLSAGQDQLLALARALLHRPAVLLLDEATAAVDNASDAAFRAALRDRVLPRGCAVLTVAHRLATALDADRVVVLDRGRVVEEGPPPTLAARPGPFAAMLELEAAGWSWRDDG